MSKFPPILRSESKGFFSSATIVGLLISLLSRFFDIGEHSGTVKDLYSLITDTWPIILGIGTDLYGKFSRMKKEDFDKSIFKSTTFWVSLSSLVLTAFGIEQEFIYEMQVRIEDIWPKITMIIGGVIAVFGSIVAKKKIKV